MRLADKVAIVTGAANGQGAATARRFVQEGARVVVADVDDEAGAQLAEELGPAAVYQHLDVGSEDDWSDAVRAVSALGRVDVLVNNAGVLSFSTIDEIELADYERVIRVNQTGPLLGMRAVIPRMSEGGGSIINVSSVEGLAGMAGVVAYTASKFAVRGMSKVAAVELGGRGIRVNSVHPGMVDTGMVSTAVGGPVPMDEIGKRVALGRVARPDEIAELAVFLAADESSYCTGAEFVADGGATATHSLG
ncbi:glucose 1-dehydrogenase [Saccharopolyspora sp. HNM0983]|uniref:Glucose 1-dehydrogenase n=1 Tax=Saccharopolyspora montiporae TaxID=2781240 RepID=A0A929BD81_9PSEU|nr:glucose 1-dehydrogenase [Saccharopolyspora sp. HNM0983]MBE9375468.1 glucose 1-dehydrogenase [Saccharopolyspora sp. HNM0983]